MIPHSWHFFLLAAAAYRLWRLIAEDTILDRPRAWVLGLPPGFDPSQDDVRIFITYREKLATFLTCPWCAGFWISCIVWGAWLVFPHATVIAAVPWALSAIVGLVAKHLE